MGEYTPRKLAHHTLGGWWAALCVVMEEWGPPATLYPILILLLLICEIRWPSWWYPLRRASFPLPVPHGPTAPATMSEANDPEKRMMRIRWRGPPHFLVRRHFVFFLDVDVCFLSRGYNKRAWLSPVKIWTRSWPQTSHDPMSPRGGIPITKGWYCWLNLHLLVFQWLVCPVSQTERNRGHWDGSWFPWNMDQILALEAIFCARVCVKGQ